MPGAMLNGSHTLRTHATARLTQCAIMCTADDGCLSVNFRTTTGECTITSASHYGNEVDFVTGLGTNYIHLTSEECIE